MAKRLTLTCLSGMILIVLSLTLSPIKAEEQIGTPNEPAWLIPLRLPRTIWESLKSIIGIKNYYGVTLPPDQVEGAAVKTPRPANCPQAMPCAQCRLLDSAKEWVSKKYKNRSHSHGDCGGAVGDIILNAGFPFIKRPEVSKNKHHDKFNRYAIDYMNFLPRLGWTKLEVTDPDQAPPGSIMIFSGPCTSTFQGVGQPSEKWGCDGPPGNRVGHATIQGEKKTNKRNENRRWTYTDGRTDRPAVSNRYFVTAFVPGPELNTLCGDP